MNKFRKITSFIISLFFVVLLFINSIIMFLNSTIINSQYYVNISNKQNIVEDICYDINLDIQTELIKNNIAISENVEIINKDMISESLNENYTNIFQFLSGKTSNIKDIDTNDYIENIDSLINKSLKDVAISSDYNYNNIINDINDKCKSSIESRIDYLELRTVLKLPVFNKISYILKIFNNKIFQYVLLLLDIISIILLLVIWNSRISKVFSYIGKSFLILGIFLFSIAVGGYFSDSYNNILIFNSYIQEFIEEVIRGYFVNYIKISCAYIAVGLILSIIYGIGLYKNNNYSKKVFNE